MSSGTWCPKCSGEVVFASPEAEVGRCSCGLQFGRADLEQVERKNAVDAQIRDYPATVKFHDLLRASLFDREERAALALEQLAAFVYGKPVSPKLVPLLTSMLPHMLPKVRAKGEVLISVLKQQTAAL